MKAKDKLKELKACQEAIDWIEDMTLEEAWNKCHRGDWMLWLYQKLYPDNLRELTLAKGHCANTVRHLMKNERSIRAVDIAIAFGEGKATREELESAAIASDAASSAIYAADAAAVDAAFSAYNTAYNTTYNTAKKQNQQATADICRKYLKPKF